MKILIVTSLLLLVACGSSKKKDRELEEREHESIQRDYVVRDASSMHRPGWVEDAEVYARSHENYNSKETRYFSFETSPLCATICRRSSAV